MAASAISNLLRKNVDAGLARVSLNKNIIRNYFSLVFSVDKRAFKRRVWFDFKGNSHMISPDRTRLISILLSNSRLPGHHSPDLWHSMLIILILLIHATTRQQ